MSYYRALGAHSSHHFLKESVVKCEVHTYDLHRKLPCRNARLCGKCLRTQYRLSVWLPGLNLCMNSSGASSAQLRMKFFFPNFSFTEGKAEGAGRKPTYLLVLSDAAKLLSRM